MTLNLGFHVFTINNKLINTTSMFQLLHFGTKRHDCVSVLKHVKFELSFDMKLERIVNSLKVN